MTIMNEIAMRETPARWEKWRCTAGACRQALLLHVAPDARGEEVWQIYERPGWVVAAPLPVCPDCGATLRREPPPARVARTETDIAHAS